MTADDTATDIRKRWNSEITLAKTRWDWFHKDGQRTVEKYRMEKAHSRSGTAQYNKDKFNVLYSTTETTRPNLYAQMPKPRVEPRNRDRAGPVQNAAVQILNSTLAYYMDENDFDYVMEQLVEDMLLPGLGCAWVSYNPTFGPAPIEEGADPASAAEIVIDETIGLNYVYWKDILTGVSRGFKGLPWMARRVYFTKAKAVKRFGKNKADMLAFDIIEKDRENEQDNRTVTPEAEVWEIWDKERGEVVWFSERCAADVLDVLPDPLKLKDFWPTPRFLRGVTNTYTIIPRPLFTQFESQADFIDLCTLKIRLLTDALRVAGVFNGAEPKIAELLTNTNKNRLIPVENWTNFQQGGGITKAIEYLPLDAIVKALIELMRARDIAKAEVYEITGFGDIQRGVSKASETLGAQQIKSEWAGARVKRMQREIQRYARDLLRIMGEVAVENCKPETLLAIAGYTEENPDFQNALAALQMLKAEKLRCATVDIETDSTILADESAERKDRTEFLAAAGAYLQQAVPAAQMAPEMAPLLAALLMFAVKTFPSAKPVEDVFARFQKQLEDRAAQAGQGQGGEGGEGGAEAAKAQTAVQTATIRAQSEQQREQMRLQQQDAESQRQAQTNMETEQARLSLEAQKEANRHSEKMQELALREREVAVKEESVLLERDRVTADIAATEREAQQRETEHSDTVALQQEASEREAAEPDEGVDNGDQ